LYVVDKPGRGKARKIGNFQGYLSDPHWSPDGKSIAVALIEGITRVPGPTEATAPESGVISSKTVEQRLAIVNVATGMARSISPADMYVYEFDWSPDGKNLAYLAAPGDGDDNWFIAELYAIDAESGTVRHIVKPPLQAANVRWSPDGKTIAFIGGLMSDEGVIGGDIYAVPAEGGAPRDLTENRKSSPNWFQWSPSSKQILMGENVAGISRWFALRGPRLRKCGRALPGSGSRSRIPTTRSPAFTTRNSEHGERPRASSGRTAAWTCKAG
jgi:Tol biopolymer transport system component